jgi:hypothetical protein
MIGLRKTAAKPSSRSPRQRRLADGPAAGAGMNIGGLTEGEVRWVGGELCKMLDDALPKDARTMESPTMAPNPPGLGGM